MQHKRILGIDPGSRITGYGLISHNQKTQSLAHIASGHWQLNAKEMGTRLGKLYHSMSDFIEAYQPTEVAIEQVFVHKNALSALKLGQARGVAIAAAVAHDLPVYEYAPKQIKQAVVGTGAGVKQQVQHMVKFLLRLVDYPQTDEADALAVAICHLNGHKTWEVR